jgi:hypothetical protein
VLEQPSSDAVSLHLNPYLSAEQGWRGLTIPGNHKRKAYTVLHNDKVLVTALLTGIPGEYGLRHSHESGELSIHFNGQMQPGVSWNPPGVFHGGTPAPQQPLSARVAENLISQAAALKGENADVALLVERISELQAQMIELSRMLEERLRPEPSPRVIVDILFPPFKTTVDDPALPEPKTVVGQWFD